MKASILVIATSIMTVIAAHAEDPTSLPPVTVIQPAPKVVEPGPKDTTAPNGAGAASSSTGKGRCADAPAGGDGSLGCINQLLKRKVDEVNPTMNVPPIDAKSSDLKTGVVNIPGVQQQYGKNFGNSVVPYRLPPPVFAPPGGVRR